MKYPLVVFIAALSFAASAGAADRQGSQVFQSVCTACHSSGVMGAPKLGSSADWAPRIAKGKDVLYSHATGGFNAMPAKGGCGSCSDGEIHNAVDYMVKQAR